MSFGDMSTTTATSGLEPFGNIVWRFSAVGISWYWVVVVLLVDVLQPLKNVTGGSILSVAGVLDRQPDFIFYLIMWLLYCIMFWFYLHSVDDNRVYVFIYKCKQTDVICLMEVGPKCNVVHHYAYYNFFHIFTVEWICKWFYT